MEAPQQSGVFTGRHTIEMNSVETPGRSTPLAQLVAALPERYLYRREIGKGGAAHVLLVHDTERNELVAVKILLSERGAVVADFGIARTVSLDRGTITNSGQSLGTAAYMSPEQCGAVRELDKRTDIYALGCVVYEMLTGEPPFTGATEQAIIARHCGEAPRSMRYVRPTIPRTVDHVVLKSLAKVRAHRYRSAGEFFDALDSAART